jgi:hypothetical protein
MVEKEGSSSESDEGAPSRDAPQPAMIEAHAAASSRASAILEVLTKADEELDLRQSEDARNRRTLDVAVIGLALGATAALLATSTANHLAALAIVATGVAGVVGRTLAGFHDLTEHEIRFGRRGPGSDDVPSVPPGLSRLRDRLASDRASLARSDRDRRTDY